jgi:hypothetical protein
VSFSRYDAFDDPYWYRGIDCLKNKLGLRDPVQLEAFELEMSSLRAGYPLDLARIRRDTFLPAMVASFAGDIGPLVTEMRGLVV